MGPKQKPVPPASWRLLSRPALDTSYVFFDDCANNAWAAKATSYSAINAWWLAESSFLGYFDQASAEKKAKLAGFPRFAFFKSPKHSAFDTEGYVSANNSLIVVSFRGTEPTRGDFVTNLMYRKIKAPDCDGHVHRGFVLALNSVWHDVKTALEQFRRESVEEGKDEPEVWFTGHSLGGALAALAAVRYGRDCGVYSVGTPRIGDAAFCESFDKKVSKRSFVHINNTDVITHLPPLFMGYRDLNAVRFIDAEYNLKDERPPFLDFVLAVLSGIATAIATRTLVCALADHMPSRYSVIIWNLYAGKP
jgi:hypothetical protein